MLPRHLWKNKERKIKHVDTVVYSIQPFTLNVVNALPNTHNNTIPQVDYYRKKSSTSSYAHQYVVYDKISH